MGGFHISPIILCSYNFDYSSIDETKKKAPRIQNGGLRGETAILNVRRFCFVLK